MKNAITKTTITGNNHMNIFNITTATKIAIMINAKSLGSKKTKNNNIIFWSII